MHHRQVLAASKPFKIMGFSSGCMYLGQQCHLLARPTDAGIPKIQTQPSHVNTMLKATLARLRSIWHFVCGESSLMVLNTAMGISLAVRQHFFYHNLAGNEPPSNGYGILGISGNVLTAANKPRYGCRICIACQNLLRNNVIRCARLINMAVRQDAPIEARNHR